MNIPKSSGANILVGDCLKLDIGNASQGYFHAASVLNDARRKKLRVEKEDNCLNYDMKYPGIFEVFPLQFGSGQYSVSLWENTGGKKYTELGIVIFEVQLFREDASFLYPNQYVNYGSETPAVIEALNNMPGFNAKQIYDSIKSYITKKYRYDYIKAATVKPGALPDINTCFEKKKGICQDLSALMVCMLRAKGIPAKLVIGYADKNYHAWVRVAVDGKRYLFDPTAAVTHQKCAASYKEERVY